MLQRRGVEVRGGRGGHVTEVLHDGRRGQADHRPELLHRQQRQAQGVSHPVTHQLEADLLQRRRVRRRVADRGVPVALRPGRQGGAVQQARRGDMPLPHAAIRRGA